ncbi:UNVERIFIED_CONTAM: hypothetical protein K2H54_026079 [Gekko kuhli]
MNRLARLPARASGPPQLRGQIFNASERSAKQLPALHSSHLARSGTARRREDAFFGGTQTTTVSRSRVALFFLYRSIQKCFTFTSERCIFLFSLFKYPRV